MPVTILQNAGLQQIMPGGGRYRNKVVGGRIDSVNFPVSAL